MYDVATGRLRRDLRRLPISIGHAHDANDAKAEDYLTRRLGRARDAARALGVAAHHEPALLPQHTD